MALPQSFPGYSGQAYGTRVAIKFQSAALGPDWPTVAPFPAQITSIISLLSFDFCPHDRAPQVVRIWMSICQIGMFPRPDFS